MKTLIAVVLGVLSASAARAQDLARYKPQCSVETLRGSEARSQNQVGACHSYASVAALEAALARAGRSRELLSPMDLFVWGQLTAERFRSLFEEAKKAPITVDAFGDGKAVDDDLRFALRSGVAYQKDVRDEDLLNRQHAMSQGAGKPAKYALSGYQYEKAALVLAINAAAARYDAAATRSEKETIDMNADGPAQIRRVYLDLLAVGGDEKARSAGLGRIFDGHKAVKALFADGAITPVRYAGPRERGPMADWILGQLDLGRPIIITVGKLKAEGGGDPAWGAFHALLIKGYRVDAQKNFVFELQNSWGTGSADGWGVVTLNNLASVVLEMEVAAYSGDKPGRCR